MNESAAVGARPSAAGFAPGAPGVTAPSVPDRHGAFLTDVIAELGFAARETVANAIEATRQTSGTPEGHLLESGVIDEQQLALAVAERNGLDHVDLDRFKVDPEAVAMIGKSTATRYAALPIAFATDGALLVAIEDPYNMLGISDIEVMTRSEVRPVIAARTQIQRLIGQLPEGVPPPVPETPPLPPQPVPAVPEPDSPPGRNGSESSGDVSQSSGDGEGDAELGELSAALATLQEKMRHAGDLIDAVEQERRQSAGRERELEQRLDEAQERISALVESQSKTDTAVELANTATEKLAELRAVLGEGRSLVEP